MGLKELSLMLQVQNLNDTIKYYEDILRFECKSHIDDEWALVERDNITLMFTSVPKEKSVQKLNFTGSLYIYTNKVDKLWLELKDKTNISYPIESFSYGMREFAIIDNNGYLIQFGQEID